MFLFLLSACSDSNDEWSALDVCPESARGTFVDERDGEDVAGNKLKAIYGCTPLNPGDNPNGTDDCGFSALPSNASNTKDDGYTLMM